jgi:hypothetical protein
MLQATVALMGRFVLFSFFLLMQSLSKLLPAQTGYQPFPIF